MQRGPSLVSYATPNFESVRQELNESALKNGVAPLFSYTAEDLHQSAYYRENRSLLDAKLGAGYWAWKPWAVLTALQSLGEGDILFYADAGSMFVAPAEPLAELCRAQPQGVLLFDARPLQNRQFTARDCFVRLDCDEEKYWNANKVIATLLVLRKCPRSVALVEEWLRHCQDPAAITGVSNYSGKTELPGFFEHRWDQSILSLLAAKHGLETFRNPTLWGNFLKLPEFRVAGEPILGPYGFVPTVTDYAPQPQANSPYGTIFVINRQPNWAGKKRWQQPSAPVSWPRRVLRFLRRSFRTALERIRPRRNRA